MTGDYIFFLLCKCISCGKSKFTKTHNRGIIKYHFCTLTKRGILLQLLNSLCLTIRYLSDRLISITRNLVPVIQSDLFKVLCPKLSLSKQSQCAMCPVHYLLDVWSLKILSLSLSKTEVIYLKGNEVCPWRQSHLIKIIPQGNTHSLIWPLLVSWPNNGQTGHSSTQWHKDNWFHDKFDISPYAF